MEEKTYPLNPKQLEAVHCTEGPVMIFAGAGSGKTRTLTYRFAHIIHSNLARPSQILAVTFTNKAAREMRERITDLTQARGFGLPVTTFHAFCLRMIREHGAAIGLDTKVSVLDGSEQKRLLATLFKEMNVNSRFLTPRRALWEIQHAKAHGILPERFTFGPYDLIKKRVAEIYEVYQKRLTALNAMDFSDILLHAYHLLTHSDATLAFFRETFRYVMVDEYQDTNFIQYQLIKLLASGHRNLCVVGDDDQSIYSWRGASKENIRLFHKDFPEAQVIKLEQNYRSTKTILKCASHLIRHNTERTEKTLWTENSDGDPVGLYEADNEADEAAWVVSTITGLNNKGMPWSAFAVFYRTNAQSRIFEEKLIHQGIPYQIFGGFKFYDRKEIKDIVAYLRCLVNPRDELSFRRAMATPSRGIGKVTLNAIATFAKDHGLSYFDALGEIAEQPGFRMKNKLQPFYDWMRGLKKSVPDLTLPEIVEKIVTDTGYLRPYRDSNDPRAQTTVENVEELVAAVTVYQQEAPLPSLEDFLDQITLMTDTDNLNEKAGRVTLMTLHSAKGLEFPVVCIAGLEEGLFPHERSLMDESKVDEERRLFYVGITRGQQRVFLSYCLERNQYGKRKTRPPSRFLRELPAGTVLIAGRSSRTPSYRSRRVAPASTVAPTAERPPGKSKGSETDFTVGERILHPIFGKGTVRVREVKGDQLKLLIRFEGQGLKLIYPGFVELVRL